MRRALLDEIIGLLTLRRYARTRVLLLGWIMHRLGHGLLFSSLDGCHCCQCNLLLQHLIYLCLEILVDSSDGCLKLSKSQFSVHGLFLELFDVLRAHL